MLSVAWSKEAHQDLLSETNSEKLADIIAVIESQHLYF